MVYGTVGGSDWAAHSTDSPNNIVGASVAGATGASLYTTAIDGATFTGNADIAATFAATSDSTVHSIRLNAGTFTLTLAGVNTVTSGGILFGGGVTAASTITGGTIQPGNGELVIITHKPNTQNVLSSVIQDNGANPTTVTFRGNPSSSTTGGILSFNANHLYTGPTYITSGRAQVTLAGVTTPFGTGANAILYPKSRNRNHGSTSGTLGAITNDSGDNIDGGVNLDNAPGTGTSTLDVDAEVNISVNQTLASLVIGAGGVVTLGGAPLAAEAPAFADAGPGIAAGFEGGAFDRPVDALAGGATTAAVPEPGSVALLMAGALGFLGRRRRSAKA